MPIGPLLNVNVADSDMAASPTLAERVGTGEISCGSLFLGVFTRVLTGVATTPWWVRVKLNVS
jgi:hypothetical protein